ncbi:MAG: LysR family transcriptional regulator [Rhodobacteraceae bacterium]|nr:LysR family transcriptional regulator [Paracoccaceae bacterium]
MRTKELELLHFLSLLGSVSDSARAINTTQPNASKMLKKLEEQFGFQLFERKNGRLYSTQEGRLITDQAESTLVSLQRLEARVRNVRDMRLGSLTVGAMPLLSRTWLPGLLAEFMASHPDIITSFQTRSSRKLFELVSERQLDLALGMLAIDDPNVESRKLFDLEMVAALPRHHPLCDKSYLEPRDFHRQDFVASSMLDRSREQVENFFEKHGAMPNERGECSLPGAMLQLVERNVGLALIDRMTADEYDGGLAVFRPLEPALHLSVWIMRPRQRPKSRLVDSFEKLVTTRAEKDAQRV